MALLVPVSWGELLDKIAILKIKSEKITDQQKLVNVRHELDLLQKVRSDNVRASNELAPLEEQLYRVNSELWLIEDDIRLCEKDGDFGPRFIELARSVYITNDRRADLKYQVNMLLGSEVVEEKSYEQYTNEK